MTTIKKTKRLKEDLLVMLFIMAVGALLVAVPVFLYIVVDTLIVYLYNTNPMIIATLPMIIIFGGMLVAYLGYFTYKCFVWKMDRLRLVRRKLKSYWYKKAGTKFDRSTLSKE